MQIVSFKNQRERESVEFVIEVVGEIAGEVLEFISELAFDKKRSFATRLICLSFIVLLAIAFVGALLFIGVCAMERTLAGGIVIIAIAALLGAFFSFGIIKKLKKSKRIE